ncbi:uncharacterized protein A1O9_08357 [Exophiala aquamarina CBS 119918]|uniref:Transcription factor domain-containing protein n=1 Tax=Exophiala aquamarina CBS 119918 TaxID=1182545 RepID=A0A072P7A6_9EURO|nr:uncharacterized protein A1O9_08357 [Exophiala aquamarina CBS 119918]KEF55607.1 hypothetical protein A1O9_08357 [Exophiala aquamarina CBS 119918]
MCRNSDNGCIWAAAIRDCRERSDTLFHACVACQAYLSHGPSESFLKFYEQLLTSVQSDLHYPYQQLNDGTLGATVLLCTIGMLQGVPWTIHLKGMKAIFDVYDQLPPSINPGPLFSHCLGIMGVFDLERLNVGRTTTCLNIWQRYRKEKFGRSNNEIDGIEIISGLPRSLIDVFAVEVSASAEEALWLWPGYEGSITQCHLWESYRLAGVLDIRHRRKEKIGNDVERADRRMSNVSNDDVLRRGLSALDAIYNGREMAAYVVDKSRPRIHTLFPLFIMTLEVISAHQHRSWHPLLESWITIEAALDQTSNTRLAWQIIEDMIESLKMGFQYTPDQIAKMRGIEVLLL